ncbi:membrane protein, TrkA-C domain pair-containing [Syntrophotalea carbinolica DSM 2380]|uniref:Membrane protein, TrkA-C domain pair-containing n=1 Tax=Syntrophotalea carbinolica (strain DSM 2380 / NBRC 103641 / GraBd1) TaxID=338963 RepID=Q3A6W1_SYNC1|nr:SLC13 family permease [Syntrophotalea carbinolica]ABA87896.1 membrane protein, TrkA-C domain pair-containing [Syntrophotalea carbinolica DSM 2380]
MTNDQVVIIVVLAATMAIFLWGRWRHDMVGVAALLACVFTGLVPENMAFSGLGHPAVITVACVLVLGYGLQITGAVDMLAQRLLPKSTGPTVSILVLVGLAALLSCFMNNVGALALLMPIAIQMANKQSLKPGQILMPLAFGSILGGMTTLIGTPPNLVVSGFRATTDMGPFAIFDFTPVGVAVAVLGVVFVALVGWRMVPAREQVDTTGFESGNYLSEVRILADSKSVGKTLGEVDLMLEESDAQIIGMIRGDVRISAPDSRRVLRENDILVIEVDPETLASTLSAMGFKLEEDVSETDEEPEEKRNGKTEKPGKQEYLESKQPQEKKKTKPKREEMVVQELVVMLNSPLVNRSATDIRLRTRYHINLLAISRQGRRSIKRLRSTVIKPGDVLLMDGAPEALTGFATQFGCLPLAKRDIRVPKTGKALTAALVMVLSLACAAFGLMPTAISFAAGALVYIVIGLVPARSIYTAIDWPVIVLLAAMLPVAEAMETTGTADLIARVLLEDVARGDAVFGLVMLLVVTMFMSDLMNNAATAAVMCPIAISTSNQLGVNADTFLMAIAVGASCAFLTPIGHQNNTLILGPGGFKFGDYWRMGLVLEIIVVAVSVPMLLLVWPL